MVTIGERAINLDNVTYVELYDRVVASVIGGKMQASVGLRFFFIGGTALRLTGAEADAWRAWLTVGAVTQPPRKRLDTIVIGSNGRYVQE